MELVFISFSFSLEKPILFFIAMDLKHLSHHFLSKILLASPFFKSIPAHILKVIIIFLTITNFQSFYGLLLYRKQPVRAPPQALTKLKIGW
jgi:hypothetical protein